MGRYLPLLALASACGASDGKPAAAPPGSGGGSAAAAGSAAAGHSESGGSSGNGEPVTVVGAGAPGKNDSYDCPPATGPTGTRPTLPVGTWVNLTPPAAGVGSSNGVLVFTNCVGVDPCNPNVIWTCTSGFNTKTFDIAPGGVWKSTDAGSTWTKLAAGVIDSPAGMAIGPNDHAYVTDGVRGQTLGFFATGDGGKTWTQAGFPAVAADPSVSQPDVSSMAVDPNDFRHVLVGFHGGWYDHGTYLGRSGLIESKDGGYTWAIHAPPSTWTTGSQGIGFLYDPKLGVGDKDTWLVGMDGAGFWRTTDAGGTWKQVSTANTGHGGDEIYYAKNGAVYAGATPDILRSTDNGATWTPIASLPGSYYFSLIGDGKSMFTMPDNNNGSMQQFYTSAEDDGQTWTAFNSQMFARGPFKMAFDPVNSVIYSASWEAGLWALKTN